ncbi:MAG: hypothetical protein WCP35_00210 [Verrucomicrobiota bacterium]
MKPLVSHVLALTLSSSALLCGAELPAPLRSGGLQVAYFLDSGRVLQRDIATPVWGRDQPGTTVTVSFNGQPAAIFRSDDWEWSDGWDRRSVGKEIEQLRATCRDRGILPAYAK